MIDKLGIGVDIASISNFKKISYDKNPGFYEKIFQPSEIQYCLKFKDPYPHFAAKFALKEAVKKSIANNIFISQIETSYRKSKPFIKLDGIKQHYNFRASLSHENDCAIAMVISELIS